AAARERSRMAAGEAVARSSAPSVRGSRACSPTRAQDAADAAAPRCSATSSPPPSRTPAPHPDSQHTPVERRAWTGASCPMLEDAAEYGEVEREARHPLGDRARDALPPRHDGSP